MPRAALASLLLILSPAAFPQTAAKLEFEVVSIKPSPAIDPNQGFSMGCSGGPETKDPVMFRCQNMDLRNLITRAYSIPTFRLTAPSWLSEQRFEISAKIPPGTSKYQFPLMLQSLLLDRFQLAVHHESKELAKFDLVLAKNGPKFKESADAPPPKAGDSPRDASGPPSNDKDGYPILAPGRPGMAMMNGRARMVYPQWTMEKFAEVVGLQLHKPVTDATGLKGKYDLSLYWAVASVRAAPPQPSGPGAIPLAPAPENDSGPTFEQALQDQLGLRLEPKKGPVDFLIVDHIEKLPSEN
jgi:uncharacterized protein (TIGR03435 family)